MSKASPQRFGKYLLHRRIALGGMAEIFQASVAGAEGFERDLVIKRILPHFSDDDVFVRMFVDEARLTAKLQHPNIVQIFDFDVVEGRYYIAMEYVEGKDLTDVLEESRRQGQRLSVAQCVWIAIEIAKGLHYAHTKQDHGQPLNIVHRDVTPSNVMVTYRGDVKLMDFGIAKAAQRSTKTQAGAVKGKVAYMSPEQARGRHIDGRTDLFALGVMLWEMLTGQRLFLADSDFETLSNVLKMQPPPPSSLNRECPRDLDPIVLKCLAKDPEERWRDAEAFGRELTRWYYSNVVDLEREKLKPFMHRLFARQLGVSGEGDPELKRRQAITIDDDDGDAVTVEVGRDQLLNKATTQVRDAVDDRAPPASEQATRVVSVQDQATLAALPVGASEAATRLVNVEELRAARDRAQRDEVRRRRAPWLWIAIVIAIVVGGVTLAAVLLGKDGPPDTSGSEGKEEGYLNYSVDLDDAAFSVHIADDAC